jgi:hypothetical protein
MQIRPSELLTMTAAQHGNNQAEYAGKIVIARRPFSDGPIVTNTRVSQI